MKRVCRVSAGMPRAHETHRLRSEQPRLALCVPIHDDNPAVASWAHISLSFYLSLSLSLSPPLSLPLFLSVSLFQSPKALPDLIERARARGREKERVRDFERALESERGRHSKGEGKQARTVTGRRELSQPISLAHTAKSLQAPFLVLSIG